MDIPSLSSRPGMLKLASLKLAVVLLASLPSSYGIYIRVAPDTELAGYPANFVAGYPAD